MKILVTGVPGVGKSTLLEKVRHQLIAQNKSVRGCVVREERINGIRDGFTIHYWPSGAETILASAQKQLSSSYVSRFSVNMSGIENELIPFMLEMSSSKICDVLIFDEIGRMQNLSPQFIGAVDALMRVSQPLIATIVYDDEVWVQPYKHNLDNFFIVLTEHNRHFVPLLIEMMLASYDDFVALNQQESLGVLKLFRVYIEQDRHLELGKLFKHTVPYLAHHKAQYDESTNSYYVHGRSAVRHVTCHDGYFCTCDFHREGVHIGQTRECSHIQTVVVLESCQPKLRKHLYSYR